MESIACIGLHVGNHSASLIYSSLMEKSRNRFRLFDCELIEQDQAIVLLSDEGNSKVGSEIQYEDDELNPHMLISNITNLIINGNYIDIDCYSPFRPLHLVKNQLGELEISTGDGRNVSPIDLYLEIIKRMLERNQCSMKNHLVLAIPDFSKDITEVILKKVKEWGYNLISINHESTLSLYAYHLFFLSMNNKVVMYLDFGSSLKIGSFEIDDGMIFKQQFVRHVKLGGESITLRMMEYCAKLFNLKHQYSIHDNPLSTIKLRRACEEAKANLSNCDSCRLYIHNLYNNIDLDIEFTRSLFEELTKDIINSAISEIHDFMDTLERVEYIVVCGKSTKIPKFKEMLSKLVNEQRPSATICDWIEYPASVGASIYACFTNDPYILMNDNTCSNYGISKENGEMEVIVPRTIVPYFKSHITSIPIQENDTFVTIDIYEGNRKFVKDCEIIGTLKLDIPENHPDSHFEVELIFELFFSTKLSILITARSTRYGTEDSFIPSKPKPLTNQEIEELLKMVASTDDSKNSIHSSNQTNQSPSIEDID